MSNQPIIYFVHCIDTEGPLDEDLTATFGRLKSIFDIDMPQSKENLKLIQEKTSLNIVSDQRGTPTSVDALAEVTYNIVKTILNVNAKQIAIDMSDIPNGLYLLEIYSGEKHINKKIVLDR